MRCVNETLPPRARARWLLMTMRLSASSLAGTARTLDAVGTVSEAFMFLTTLAAAPRRGSRFGPSPAGWPGAVAGLLVGGGLLGGGGRLPVGGRGRRGGRLELGGLSGLSGRCRPVVARGHRAARPVVGKKLMPRLVHARGIGEVLLVHLLDQPLVGAESRHR